MAIHQEESASSQANSASYGKLVYIIGYIILGVGAIYADVMFVSLLSGALPSGPLGVAAIMGAFLTSASLMALVIGKSHLFRPGDQITWAWLFTWIEIAVMCLNVLLSALHGMGVDPGYLSYWLYLCPATPFVAVIGWIMLIYADPRRHHLHEDMAMEDQLIDGKRKHVHNVHKVRLSLQNAALEQQRVYMEQYMQTPEVQRTLKYGSEQIALGIVSEIIQRPIMPQAAAPTSTPPGRIIDSTAKRIDTTGHLRAVKPLPQPKKKLPPARKFTPRTAPASFVEEKEIETGPLASRPVGVQVKKNQGPYVVNRKQAKLPVND